MNNNKLHNKESNPHHCSPVFMLFYLMIDLFYIDLIKLVLNCLYLMFIEHATIDINM